MPPAGPQDLERRLRPRHRPEPRRHARGHTEKAFRGVQRGLGGI